MAFEKLLSTTTSDGVLVLTLNDPATLNAIGEALGAELLSEVDRFAADPTLRALVITGAGRAFCSGANLRGFAREIDARETAGPADAGTAPDPTIMKRLYDLEKPSFAAVDGYAYGAGCGIALACDFRIAAESARFSEAFVRFGVAPPDGSTWRLPKLVGMSKALWMQYSGEPVSGAEAYRIGLADWLVPDDRLMDETLALATRLARGPAQAMAAIKRLVRDGYQEDLSEHYEQTAHAFGRLRETDDYREGVRAFIEKRRPDFRGT